jgi:DNA polymerase-3 subunit epsilon
MAKLIFYDTETTGTNYKKHSIIELSGIIEIDGKTAETFDYRVRPHAKAEVDSAALTANGHKMEDLPNYPSMLQVHEEFTVLLKKYVDPYDKKDKIHLVGYNNRGFDDNFLRMFFNLCEDQFYGAYFWADTIDVMVLASRHLIEERASMPSFKLFRVAQTLGIPVDHDRLHEALYDSILVREIYRTIFTDSFM